jgi:type IV pilus biogenesis protein CpaD/CtpE
MSAHASNRRTRRPRLGGLACAALVAALAGCATENVPYIARSHYSTGPSETAYALYFQRGAVDLEGGELLRMQDILRSLELRRGDDILVRLAVTGSEPLDEGRLATAAAAVAGTPARVRVVGSAASPLGAGRTDIAVVEVVRNGRIRVICPTPAIDSWERDRLAVMPPVACANALNIAEMAANPRDLVSPRQLVGSNGVVAAEAVERYRLDQVKQPDPIDSTGN